MLKRIVLVICVFMLGLGLSGCATTRKSADLEAQGLRNQILALETQLQSKDEEINSLKEALTKTQGPDETQEVTRKSSKKRLIPEVKSRPNVKQIQIALKNAGFDPGPIDGKMGSQTKEAIRTFQRANNLPRDGQVGKKTWGMLSEYLYKKVK